MGTSVSKPTEVDKKDVADCKLLSTPVQAPQFRRLDIDPRSPSSDIARTPIEVLKTPLVRSVINSVDNSLNITEDLHNLDEAHTTPTITDAVLQLQSMTLHNKNLDNARMPVVAITPVKPKKLPEKVVRKIYGTPETETVKIVSPKLLESSPISVKLPENKRNSVVGLLETNIDFVETDLDVVIQNKTLKTLELSSNSDGASDDVEAPTTPNSTAETSNSVESDCEVESSAENQQAFEVKINNLTEISDINNVPDLTADAKDMPSVDELDRKLTNLIYEDKQANTTPKTNKFVGTHRTPLGDRDSNSQQRKSIPVLKVSDKPTKPIGTLSKIPVFKENRVKGKVNVQCENTPPRMKPKRSQWSAEDSIII